MATTRLTRSKTPAATPLVLPVDVRLMNAVSAAVFVLAALLLLAAGARLLTRSPGFDIRSVRVEGELQRVDTLALRSAVLPRLAGNFFGADLARARAAFEDVPWVRRAVVRRVWPDRLVVQIEEHRSAALWQGEERDDRLVNLQGEVFTANVGDVEDDALPTFSGPEGSAATMLAVYRRVQPLLQAADMPIEQLQLSARGSWRALLDSGATLELGRGSDAEVAARTERFVRTVAEVTRRLHAPLEYADLRHADGYAVRLRGITTTPAGDARPTL